jgi:predicted transcriptional regulator
MPTVQLNCRIEQELAERLNQAATARQLDIETLVEQAIKQFLGAASSEASRSHASGTSEIAAGLAALTKRVESLEATATATATARQDAPAAMGPSPEREKVDGLLAALMAKSAPPAKP